MTLGVFRPDAADLRNGALKDDGLTDSKLHDVTPKRDGRQAG